MDKFDINRGLAATFRATVIGGALAAIMWLMGADPVANGLAAAVGSLLVDNFRA